MSYKFTRGQFKRDKLSWCKDCREFKKPHSIQECCEVTEQAFQRALQRFLENEELFQEIEQHLQNR